MAYNKDLLKAAGIDKPATTWDELAQQAKKLTTGGTYGLAIAYKDSFDPWKFVWGMSIQAGNPLIDGKTAKLDDPTTKKAYDTYFGWLTTDKVVDPASIGWANAQALAAFAEGQGGVLPDDDVHVRANPGQGRRSRASTRTRCCRRCPPGATSLPSGGKDAASILSGDNLRRRGLQPRTRTWRSSSSS